MSHETGDSAALPLEALKAGIEAYIEKSRPVIVEDLRKILTFETVSGGKTKAEQAAYRNAIREGLAWIGQRAKDLGLEFRNLDNVVGVVEQPGRGGSLGVLLHLDVVPPGEGWTHPPFGGAMDNGVIYGRGCEDDKGPLAEALHALAAVKSLGRPFRRSVRLIIGTEEETGLWNDMKWYLEREGAPDLSIVPDAVFPIVNGEKGMVDIGFSAPPRAPESGPLRIGSVRAGERPNIVPHACEVALDCEDGGAVENVRAALAAFLEAHSEAKADFRSAPEGDGRAIRVAFHGRNAHGSTPEEGHNAARDAVMFLTGVAGLAGPRVEFVRFLAAVAADDLGQGLGIAMTHPFIGATTQNLGILSVGPNQCHAVFNIRPTLGQRTGDILKAARAKALEWSRGDPRLTAEVEGKPYDPLYLDPEGHPEFFAALKTAYSSVTGREAALIATPGTTFAKAFPNAICFGPTDPAEQENLAHKADERIHVDHLFRNVRIYGAAIGLLALADE